MTRGLDWRAALIASAVVGASGCAAGEKLPATVSSPAPAPASDAERLAVALADAARAYERADEATLSAALRRVDALGAKPLDGTGDELRLWRQSVDLGPPMRGRPLGPGFRSGTLSPGASVQLEQVFLSGERASIAVSAPGKVRLRLDIQDRRDEPVCGRAGNPSQCQWIPTFTDRYRIRIANLGDSEARYFLVID